MKRRNRFVQLLFDPKIPWIHILISAVNVISLYVPANPYEKVLKSLYGLTDKQESYCIIDRDYDMGRVCHLNNDFGFMPAAEYFLRRESSLVDKSGCPLYSNTLYPTPEFIVVGSGVGSVVARRLAEAGFLVTILEAGGPPPVGTQIPGTYFTYLKSPDVDWNFELEPEKGACLATGGICYWPKGKMVGGTSQLNGMMYMRGYPQDFESYNVTAWKWDDVMKFYLKSEDNQQIGSFADAGYSSNGIPYHSKGGYLTVSRFPDYPEIAGDILKAAKNMGYHVNNDMNGKIRTGFTLAQATVRNGERLSTSKAFLYASPTLSNLIVQHNALVKRVLFDNNKNAIGVQYEKAGNTYFLRARKEVILSAGTINSPQILMLSGIGPRDLLAKHGIRVIKESPGVGQNLRNHASVNVNFNVLNTSNINQLNVDTLNEFLKYRKGPLTSTGLSQVTGFVYTDPDIDQTSFPPDLQIFFSRFLAGCSKNGSTEPLPEALKISIVPTLLRPQSVGYLEIASSNVKDPPKIYSKLLNDPNDVTVINRGIRIVLKLSQIKPLRDRIQLDPQPCPELNGIDVSSDRYWECIIRWYTNPENHQVGTCKMGNDNDKFAVTDPELRVRGVQMLRVIDASIFPQVTSGNLIAPAIMAAERGAEFIIDSWK